MDTCFILPILWVLGASAISGLIGWLWAKRKSSSIDAKRNMELENYKISSSNDLQKMQNKFASADRMRLESENELDTLRDKYVQLQNTKAIVKSRPEDKELSKSMKTLEDKLNKTKNENSRLSKLIKEQPKLSAKGTSVLKTQISRLEKNNTKLSNALKQKDSIISKSADTYKAKAVALNKNIATLKSEIRGLNKKKPKVSNKVVEALERKIKKVTMANGTLSNQLKRYEKGQKGTKASDAKLQKMSDEVLKLKQQLKDKNAKLKAKSSRTQESGAKVKTSAKKGKGKKKIALKKLRKANKKLRKQLAQNDKKVTKNKKN